MQQCHLLDRGKWLMTPQTVNAYFNWQMNDMNFPDQGRQYDAQGNLKDWWTKVDAKNFTDRAQCIVDQYAQYIVVDEVKINSALSKGEDIADLGGLILAWMAWRIRQRT
jgi:putative endopeptidase